MARIIFHDGTEHELDPTEPTTVGASQDATIHCAGASDVHCVIRSLKDGGYGIKDLGSTSGTLVNHKPVRTARLYSGDSIEIGGIGLTFEDASMPRPVAQQEEQAKAPEAVTPVKQTMGGYEILSVIGHGGMGTVYKAMQLSLHREVAIKVLKDDLCKDPSFVKRFVSEARAAGRFNHPNVVQVFDVDEHNGKPFYSMELLPGESLEGVIKRQGQLEFDAAVSAIDDAARGLAYADELGIVHRDIKPDNLMPTAQGSIKICDLGLAAAPNKVEGKGRILGTPHFISPEQVRGEAVDHRSDLYSLGCTFYRLLAGKNPYPRRTVREILKAHLEAPVPRLKDARPDTPDEVDAAVAMLMAKDPAARYQHAAALVADLEAWLQKRRRSKLPLILGSAVLLVAVFGVFQLTRGNGAKVIKVVETDPNAAKIRGENKELEAKLARTKIMVTVPIERATALEKMAKLHPDTAAARGALKEAAALRTSEADRLAKLAKRQAREQQLARAIESEAGPLLAAGDPLLAWKRGLALAGTGQRAAIVEKAVASLGGKVLEAIRKRSEAAFATFEKTATTTGSKLDDVLQAFRAAVALPEGRARPEGTTEVVSAFQVRAARLVEDEGARRIAETQKRHGEFVAARRALLLGKGGVLELARRGDLTAAMSKIDALSTPSDLTKEWVPIVALRDLLGLAATARNALAKDIADGRTPVVTRLGEDSRATKLAKGQITLTSGSGSDEVLPLWTSPEILASLFGKREQEKAVPASRLAALVVAGLANGLPVAEQMMQHTNGGAATGAAFPHGIARAFAAARAGHNTHPRPVVLEGKALVVLSRMLQALQNNAHDLCDHWAETLERDHASTVTGVALGLR